MTITAGGRPTERETVVILRVGQGRSNPQIGHEVFMAATSVRNAQWKIRNKYYEGAPTSASMIYAAAIHGHIPILDRMPQPLLVADQYLDTLYGIALGLQMRVLARITGVSYDKHRTNQVRLKNLLGASTNEHLVYNAFRANMLPVAEKRARELLRVSALPSWCRA